MKKFLFLLREENTEEKNQYYIHAIEHFGGDVVCVLDSDSQDMVLDVLQQVEGILLPGGVQVGKLDYFLVDYALCHSLKLFGICQGMQSMALCYTTKSLENIGNFSHQQEEGYFHSVLLLHSRLRDIVNRGELKVNSHHIQKVTSSFAFSIVGLSDDGIIEAIENPLHSFQIGVQWHPERMFADDVSSYKLFESFVEK